MVAINIRPEISAQPTTARPNPMVPRSIEYLRKEKSVRKVDVVDLGCGKLRHVPLLREIARTLILVDTNYQVTRKQVLKGRRTTLKEYVAELDGTGEISLLTFQEFQRATLKADIVFSIAVMDVVLEEEREKMFWEAFRHLRKGGFFIVIVPRNDSSILKRCTEKNKYQDGFVFRRGHTVFTFYRNFRDHSSLVEKGKSVGFQLERDLSIYRQVCLLFTK